MACDKLKYDFNYMILIVSDQKKEKKRFLELPILHVFSKINK